MRHFARFSRLLRQPVWGQFCYLALFFSFACQAGSQIVQQFDPNFVTTANTLRGLNGGPGNVHISLTNGSPHFELPLFHLRQRNGGYLDLGLIGGNTEFYIATSTDPIPSNNRNEHANVFSWLPSEDDGMATIAGPPLSYGLPVGGLKPNLPYLIVREGPGPDQVGATIDGQQLGREYWFGIYHTACLNS